MKKLIAFLLVLFALLASFNLVAFADEEIFTEEQIDRKSVV